jgi:hypothetical protein
MNDKWTIFISQFIGTAVLLLVGLSIVILDFGEGSPVTRLIPDEGARRLITGFFFGTTGALIAVSKSGTSDADMWTCQFVVSDGRFIEDSPKRLMSCLYVSNSN